MDSIRKEIEAEIKRARLDKGRLYDLLLKIVDSGVGGGTGAQGPAGPQGPAGAPGVCRCTCTKEDKPKVVAPKDEKPAAKPVVKKTTTTTKKKTSASST